MSRKPADFRAQIPKPAHPEQRREPLPWHQPKPEQDDPRARQRLAEILRSPNYRLAEEDADFVARDELRGVRLQIEYLKPEILLEDYGIKHTIVVYGSTRIPEPAAAKRNVEDLRKALGKDAHDAELVRRLKIAESVLAKSHFYDIAREFGRLVSSANHAKHHTVVMTGGGPGIMEAANRGAYDVDAKSIGLNIQLPHQQYPNPYITPDLCFSFRYFALRKLHLLLRAKALVVFPGGFGTLDELFEVLTLIQTRKINPIPVVLVGEAYWRRVIDFEFLVEEGAVDLEDRDLFWFAETAEQIWQGILHWHAESGQPLHNAP